MKKNTTATLVFWNTLRLKNLFLSRSTFSLGAISALSLFGLSTTLGGCAGPQIQSQAYATLSPERDLDDSIERVWKACLKAFQMHKIVRIEPKEPVDWNKVTSRTLQLDWIYGQSSEHYQVFQYNGLPQRIQLKNRVLIEVQLQRQLGSTHVAVRVQEEIKPLNEDGTPRDGYEQAPQSTGKLAREIMDKIQVSLNQLPLQSH